MNIKIKKLTLQNSSNIINLRFGKKDKNTNQPKRVKHDFEQNLVE